MTKPINILLNKGMAVGRTVLPSVLLSVALLTGPFARDAKPQTGAEDISPARLSSVFSEIARRVEPAVVNIESKSNAPEPVSLNGQPGGVLGFPDRQTRPSSAVGSGFIVDAKGYIVTNNHVVEDSFRIIVRLQNGDEYDAKIVGTDEETDLAVLKIDAPGELPFVKFADSDAARVGDWVLAVGSPFGLEQSVTAGIISQLNRATPYASVFQKFIQTDAAINRGNSGGPLVNMSGEVVGVNSQIATSTGDYNGIGFALPSNEASGVFRQIFLSGRVRRGYLGVSLESVKSEFAKVYGLPEAKGAIVVDVRDKKSAAASAGLAVGDVILEIDGKKILSAEDMIAKVAATLPEQTIEVVFMREAGDGLERKTVSVKLGERPGTRKNIGDEGSPSDEKRRATDDFAKPFGLTVVDVNSSATNAKKNSSTSGVEVKEIDATSFISDVKLQSGADAIRRGDVIARINRVTITDVKMFSEFVSRLKKGDPVVLKIFSNNASGGLTQTKIVQFTVK